MKKVIENVLAICISNWNLLTKWELRKYEIRNSTVKYTKGLAKKLKQRMLFGK